MKIKLMPDYGCSPLWWDGERGRVGDIDPAEIGLSDVLKADLYAWAAQFDATLDQDDPARSRFPTRDAFDRFVDDGATLRDRVADALGVEWRVRYVPPPA